jgi:hypothetical protein
MSTFCLDMVNGSDSANGTTWTLAWKTMTNGAIAGRIAPGDIIKLAKTPAPTSLGNGTWSKSVLAAGKKVTLATAQTAAIDNCDAGWTIGPYTPLVTQTVTTSRSKEGTGCLRVVIPGNYWNYTTDPQMAMYKSLTSADLSAYQQLCFWVYNYNGSLDISICLCSDTSGSVIVNQFDLPANIVTNTWTPVVIDYGSALGSAIQSVAIYKRTRTYAGEDFYIDNVFVCKAPSSSTCLSLKSVISKNSSAYGGSEGWYPIKAINGTAVYLEDGLTYVGQDQKGEDPNYEWWRCYSGTTETVTTYVRQPVTPSGSMNSTEAGTAGSLIQYQGGFDPATDIQDGETFIGDMGLGAVHDYILMNRINVVRGSVTVSGNFCDVSMQTVAKGQVAVTGHKNDIEITNIINGSGLYVTGRRNAITCTTVSNGYSANMTVYGRLNKITATNCDNSYQSNVSLSSRARENRFYITNCKDGRYYGVVFYADAYDNWFYDMVTSGNDSGVNDVYRSQAVLLYLGTSASPGRNFFVNPTFGETYSFYNPYGLFADYVENSIAILKYGGDVNDNRTYTDGGEIKSQVAVRHTAADVAWQILPTKTTRNETYPLTMLLRRVALNSGSLVTVNCYFRRSNTGITGRLICRGGQIPGVDADVYSDLSVAADTWDQLSLSFTPSAAGVIELEAQVWGGTTYSVFVDDIEVLQ